MIEAHFPNGRVAFGCETLGGVFNYAEHHQIIYARLGVTHSPVVAAFAATYGNDVIAQGMYTDPRNIIAEFIQCENVQLIRTDRTLLDFGITLKSGEKIGPYPQIDKHGTTIGNRVAVEFNDHNGHTILFSPILPYVKFSSIVIYLRRVYQKLISSEE